MTHRLDDTSSGNSSSRRPRDQQPGSVVQGRRDYSNFETVEVLHDLTETERVCKKCSAPYLAFGKETSEQIDWQVRIVRIVHHRSRVPAQLQMSGAWCAGSPYSSQGDTEGNVHLAVFGTAAHLEVRPRSTP